MAQGFLLFFLCGPLSHIHLRINISQRVKVITSTNTWYHWSAKAHILLKFQLCSSFKTQLRNDCTNNGSRVLTFPYLAAYLSSYREKAIKALRRTHLGVAGHLSTQGRRNRPPPPEPPGRGSSGLVSSPALNISAFFYLEMIF